MQLLLMRGLERLHDSPRFMEREERFEQALAPQDVRRMGLEITRTPQSPPTKDGS